MTRIVPTDVKNGGIPLKPETQATRRNAREFFTKYFLEGQNLNNSLKNEHEIKGVHLPFHERYRKYIAFVLPFYIFSNLLVVIGNTLQFVSFISFAV
ncbi:hypothetical protein M3Y98_00957600 [Aphelenchoides besseyi]|nr:hypothetical protein M3Y98_00957600 [Aphelenchoides besseyi]